jgi:hypothetical protein
MRRVHSVFNSICIAWSNNGRLRTGIVVELGLLWFAGLCFAGADGPRHRTGKGRPMRVTNLLDAHQFASNAALRADRFASTYSVAKVRGLRTARLREPKSHRTLDSVLKALRFSEKCMPLFA